MAQFRYFAIPHNAKVAISAVIREDQIPRDADGNFIVAVEEVPVAPVEGATKTVKKPATGTVVFGGKQNPEERAAKFNLEKLLFLGFLPNNIVLVPDAKRPGWYGLRVWLATVAMSTRRSFTDWGAAGAFALDVISQKWSFVMVYDNGDSWSFNFSGRTLDDLHSKYFGLVPKVVPVSEGQNKANVSGPKTTPPVKAPARVPTLLQSEPQTAIGIAFARVLSDRAV